MQGATSLVRRGASSKRRHNGVFRQGGMPDLSVLHHSGSLQLMSERRSNERFEVCLDVVLEGATGQARVADLSESGCYIDTLFESYTGQKLRLMIKLPTREWLELEGEVAHNVPHMGLGIRFINLEPGKREKISWLLRHLERFREDWWRRAS